MSLIVRILDKMDQQISLALADGRRPDYFVLREEEWEEIKERLAGLSGTIAKEFGDTYQGVPVKTGFLGEDDLARLITAQHSQGVRFL